MITTLTLAAALAVPEPFQSWPDGLAPKTVGARVVAQFMSTEPEAYAAKGFDAGYPYGGGTYVCYSVVSLWVNALAYSEIVGDGVLQAGLVDRFRPFLPGGRKQDKVTRARHVDFNVFGAVPLEVAILTCDKAARDMGLLCWRGSGTNDTVKRYSRGCLVMVDPSVCRLRVRFGTAEERKQGEFRNAMIDTEI